MHKIYLFIRIYSCDKKHYINLLIERKNNISMPYIFTLIDNTPSLKSPIKFILKIYDFPLSNNYLLKEINKADKEYYFDNIYQLISNKYDNINNSLNPDLNKIQFAQEEKIKELEKLLRQEKSINKSLYEKINKLENSLNEKINQNEDLKKQLKNFEDLLDAKTNKINNKIKEFDDKTNKLDELEIIKKNEIDNLKSKLKMYPFELLPGEKMMSIIIWSTDQGVHSSFICKNTDLFVHIELKVYEKYPKYTENENYFTVNGIKINKYKSLEKNEIKDSDIIILNPIK